MTTKTIRTPEGTTIRSRPRARIRRAEKRSDRAEWRREAADEARLQRSLLR